MSKKKRRILFVCIFIGLVSILILAFGTSKERIYHIPQAEMYLKIVKPPMVKYGYVLLSQDSVFSSFDKMDYLKILKSDINQTFIIINPSIKKELYIDDRFYCLDIHQVNYKICKIDFRNTTFYSIHNTALPNPYELKSPYIVITIGAFLDYVYFSNVNEKYCTEIMPW